MLSATALPSWAKNWNADDFQDYPYENKDFYSRAVEAIIPKTDTPGAADIGAHLYVERMIADCYGSDVQQLMQQTIQVLEKAAQKNYSKTFSALDNSQTVSLLKENQSDKGVNLLKRLTLRAYTTSEYYLVNQKDYTIAPGFFSGCVDVVS